MPNDKKKAKKGLFSFLYDDDKEVKQDVPVKEEAAPAAKAASTATPTAVVTPPQAGQIDEEVLTRLNNVLEESNIEGFDYFEFRESLENMKKVVPSEADRFKAAYAAVASIVSVDRLIETADYYVEKLNGKADEFANYVALMLAEKVEAKEKEAEDKASQITEKTEKIKQLNEEINQLSEEKTALLNESVNNKADIDKVQMNFNSTQQKIIKDIESDKGKIETYLAPPAEAVKEPEAK